MARISGIGLLYATAGGILVWSGIKGQPVASVVQETVHGQQPSGANSEPVSTDVGTLTADVTSSGTAGNPADANKTGVAALQSAAKAYGWDTGQEWSDLNYVEMREAGYSATAKNPSSGALGLAQALGHGTSGTAGSLGNEYGGYGLTDAQAQQANSGNAYWQAVWMVNYIKSAYGTPSAAAAHERANNWY